MKGTDSIHEWLNAISQPPSFDTDILRKPTLLCKRTYPISPDPDESASISTPKAKKRKADDENNPEKTPRGTVPQASAISHPSSVPSPSPSPSKSSTSIRSSSHASSRASSSRGQLAELDIGQEGIRKRQLSGPRTPGLPRPIGDALRLIQRLERGRGILSLRSDAPEMEALMEEFDLDDQAFSESEGGGSRLVSSDVDEILEDAKRCLLMDHDETVWNAKVHQPLLKKVLRCPTSTSNSSRLVDFTLSYVHPDRRIDFCIYINPSGDPSLVPRIEALRQDLPGQSINHSSYSPLRSCPITVSVETKRTGNDFDSGILQIAVWQAAQWKQLRFLLHKTWQRRFSPASPAPTSEQQFVDEALEKLGALHGILIQGHQWYYVATSPEFTDAQGSPSLRTVRCNTAGINRKCTE
ncbi:hypothetical protein F66182_6415 [Fusarium sp. NRRL 66182]|nr:hypothetical protein F66182_6415 [Fusarium sp. NRRL 66182]